MKREAIAVCIQDLKPLVTGANAGASSGGGGGGGSGISSSAAPAVDPTKPGLTPFEVVQFCAHANPGSVILKP